MMVILIVVFIGYTYLLAYGFSVAIFILTCSPLGGQARGKPRYPT
jgi:hypothetical protein